MKLYHHPVSGHSHRVRLFLSLIQAPVELVKLDLSQGAHKRPEFLSLNRFGQVPVLDDDGIIVQDSNAILVYLATKFERDDWLPKDACNAASVQRWLSVAAGQVAFGPGAARLITLFGAPFNAGEVIGRAHALLTVINSELSTRDWIAAPKAHPTIADVALYSYIERAPEGNIDLTPFALVNAWLRRIEALPGFVPFERNPVGLEQHKIPTQ
jgi:glutathione S-transferase